MKLKHWLDKNMKIREVFNMIYYHQITDEELYLTDGNIPNYGGNDLIPRR